MASFPQQLIGSIQSGIQLLAPRAGITSGLAEPKLGRGFSPNWYRCIFTLGGVPEEIRTFSGLSIAHTGFFVGYQAGRNDSGVSVYFLVPVYLSAMSEIVPAYVAAVCTQLVLLYFCNMPGGHGESRRVFVYNVLGASSVTDLDVFTRGLEG